MKNDDQLKIAELYEEGFWDRFKAGASGIKAGATSLVSGQGYAKANQSAKLSSLMSGKLASIMSDITKFETDIAKYTKDPNSPQMAQKVSQLKQIISSFN